MVEAVRRFTACLSLLLVIPGCTSVRRVEPTTVIRPDGGIGRNDLVGATLKDGREMRFDVNSSTLVRADTLRTSVAKQATSIPLADLQAVWVKSTDVKKTTLLLLGAGLLYLAVGALAAQSIDYGSWPTN